MSVARVLALAFGVLVFLVMAAPASAQSSRPPVPPGASDLLAKAQDALRERLQQQSMTFRLEMPAQKPRVVCGMMVVPADPTIDAAMRHPPPNPDRVKFILRTVEPACRP